MAEVSAEELASWLNVSRRRVNQLVKEGVIPKRGVEGHPLQESVLGYIRFLQAPSLASGGSGQTPATELVAIRLERARVALQLEQLEFHDAAGAVIAIEDATAYVTGVVEAARTVLQLVPRKHGTDAEDRVRLKAVCNDTLAAIIDASTKAIQALAPAAAPVEPDEPTDEEEEEE